jgi:hypothetical protein
MLGLGNSLIGGTPPQLFSPIDISNLVAWWDFTDTSVIYSDDGSTQITSGDGIKRIDNKAYTLQNNAATALGQYLEQGDASLRPAWHPTGKAVFGTLGAATELQVKNNTHDDGSGITTSDLNGAALTIFYVVNNIDGIVSGDEYLFNACGANTRDRISIYVDNDTNDRWQWHLQNNTARTNTVMNCGVNPTSGVELYTVHLDNASESSFYRNGDTSDGINNSGSTQDYTIDTSSSGAAVSVTLGDGTGDNDGFNLAGAIVEVIIYNEALSSDNLTLVQNFLLSKHSIS